MQISRSQTIKKIAVDILGLLKGCCRALWNWWSFKLQEISNVSRIWWIGWEKLSKGDKDVLCDWKWYLNITDCHRPFVCLTGTVTQEHYGIGRVSDYRKSVVQIGVFVNTMGGRSRKGLKDVFWGFWWTQLKNIRKGYPLRFRFQWYKSVETQVTK